MKTSARSPLHQSVLSRGVHGVLLELLSCKPNLHTAVEVTGGNQLFHVVVEGDAVATRIVEVLARDKLGRATFLPLNRLNPPDVKYPDHGSDAVPMLKLLKFNPRFATTMDEGGVGGGVGGGGGTGGGGGGGEGTSWGQTCWLGLVPSPTESFGPN